MKATVILLIIVLLICVGWTKTLDDYRYEVKLMLENMDIDFDEYIVLLDELENPVSGCDRVLFYFDDVSVCSDEYDPSKGQVWYGFQYDAEQDSIDRHRLHSKVSYGPFETELDIDLLKKSVNKINLVWTFSGGELQMGNYVYRGVMHGLRPIRRNLSEVQNSALYGSGKMLNGGLLRYTIGPGTVYYGLSLLELNGDNSSLYQRSQVLSYIMNFKSMELSPVFYSSYLESEILSRSDNHYVVGVEGRFEGVTPFLFIDLNSKGLLGGSDVKKKSGNSSIRIYGRYATSNFGAGEITGPGILPDTTWWGVRNGSVENLYLRTGYGYKDADWKVGYAGVLSMNKDSVNYHRAGINGIWNASHGQLEAGLHWQRIDTSRMPMCRIGALYRLDNYSFSIGLKKREPEYSGEQWYPLTIGVKRVHPGVLDDTIALEFDRIDYANRATSLFYTLNLIVLKPINSGSIIRANIKVKADIENEHKVKNPLVYLGIGCKW